MSEGKTKAVENVLTDKPGEYRDICITLEFLVKDIVFENTPLLIFVFKGFDQLVQLPIKLER